MYEGRRYGHLLDFLLSLSFSSHLKYNMRIPVSRRMTSPSKGREFQNLRTSIVIETMMELPILRSLTSSFPVKKRRNSEKDEELGFDIPKRISEVTVRGPG